MSVPARTWLVTGASRGFGRELATAAAERGDLVFAGARRTADLADLAAAFPDRVTAVPLDVTDPQSVRDAVDTTLTRAGRIDVAVNNAGFAVQGSLEELTEDDVRRQFETNLFGALRVTRAVLPAMRDQRSGNLVQMSSISGAQPWVGFSMYVASKHALEGFSSSLAAEVAPWGIRVTIVEPGPARTDFFTTSMVRSAPRPEYAETVGRMRAFLETFVQPGDPRRGARTVLTALDAPEPPLRLALGAYAVDEFRAEYGARLAEIDAWETLSRGADFPADAPAVPR